MENNKKVKKQKDDVYRFQYLNTYSMKKKLLFKVIEEKILELKKMQTFKGSAKF